MAKSRTQQRLKSMFKNSIFSRSHRNRNRKIQNPDDNTTPPPSPSTSPPPNQPSPPPPSPPLFYLCPISTNLMADPIILPSGVSFERNFILACIHLNFNRPNGFRISLPPPSANLTPNLALQHAILEWCSHSRHPLPFAVPFDDAIEFVKNLISATTTTAHHDSSLHHQHHHHHQTLQTVKIEKPNKPTFSAVESALTSFLRNPPASCTHSMLDEVVPCLRNLDKRIQELAADVVHTLSINPSNADVLLETEAVADLRVVLSSGTPHARARAAEAVHNLVERDESYRFKIGALGLIRPLLKQFLDPGDDVDGAHKKTAGLALYYLASRAENVLIMAEIGAVQKLLEALGDERSTASMRRHALMLLYCMMGSEKGREEFFEERGDGGAAEEDEGRRAEGGGALLDGDVQGVQRVHGEV